MRRAAESRSLIQKGEVRLWSKRTVADYRAEITDLKDQITDLEEENETLQEQLDEVADIVAPEEDEDEEYEGANDDRA
jgi:predicted RNase H-like nuclease (RuvC/YqgF family)